MQGQAAKARAEGCFGGIDPRKKGLNRVVLGRFCKTIAGFYSF